MIETLGEPRTHQLWGRQRTGRKESAAYENADKAHFQPKENLVGVKVDAFSKL